MPRLLERSRSPLYTRTRLVHSTRKGDLILAALFPVLKAFRLQLRGLGALVYRQANLEVGDTRLLLA